MSKQSDKDDVISNNLQSLPLEYIIAAPMTGVLKSQALAAKTTLEFIEQVGSKQAPDGSVSLATVDFKYQKTMPAMGGGMPQVQNGNLSVPLLSLVPIPYIRIKDLMINFNFNIRDTTINRNSTNSTVNTQASGSGGFLWWRMNVSVTGSVTHNTSKEHTLDKNATMNVVVNAVQDEAPEGMRTVLGILNSMIKEPAPQMSSYGPPRGPPVPPRQGGMPPPPGMHPR